MGLNWIDCTVDVGDASGISDGMVVGALVCVGSCSGVLVSVGASVGMDVGDGGGVSDGVPVGVISWVGAVVG